ncbi:MULTISPECIES: hypothetical protein [Actinoplanes]|uniref:hypothetical protein n=1 Tax=Actinoplanes TaxID=1865 RepID=UPI000AA094AE|nr:MULTISPECIES: hypothetical protein [Actinoplanes]GLY04808.1 hypothetical protein Acsp01_51870 [Actinoplanes sp. NBRC 101535]
MVLTDRVAIRETGHTRRRVLATAGAVAGATTLGGCFGDDPEPPPAPDALQPLLDEALTMAAAYERAVVAQPALADRLTPLAEDHRAHATELATMIGATLPSAVAAPSASGSATDGDSTADLRKAEQTAQKNAVAACRTAPAERAALVGSIAASRATHAEALR